MRWWAFFPLWCGVMIVMGLTVPAPRRAPWPWTSVDVPWAADRCVVLSSPAGIHTYLPDSIRMMPVPRARMRRLVSNARELGHERSEFLYWAAAVPDSVDIAGYHTRIVRIPAVGATGVGRIVGADWPPGPLWQELLGERLTAQQSRVLVREIQCGHSDRWPEPSRP